MFEQQSRADLLRGTGSVSGTGRFTEIHERGTGMLKMTELIGPDDAATVSQLLGDLGQASEVPRDISAAAQFWASEITPEMDRVDLQTVSWLLRDASAQRRIAPAQRDQARYWAAYIEGRIAR
jgi:hypothetical protein